MWHAGGVFFLNWFLNEEKGQKKKAKMISNREKTGREWERMKGEVEESREQGAERERDRLSEDSRRLPKPLQPPKQYKHKEAIHLLLLTLPVLPTYRREFQKQLLKRRETLESTVINRPHVTRTAAAAVAAKLMHQSQDEMQAASQ